MKHVSWVLALVVGGVVGFFLRASIDSRPTRPQAAQPAQARPPRPVEDPKAVYRVPLEDSPSKGPADALVTIVESSDFECPFCKRVLPTLKQIEEAYPGKVRFVWKHNPLSFHARALPSAVAAEEARAQGGDAKFWAMHDALFASAPALSDDDLVRAGQGIGLDAAKLREALASRRHAGRIERDQKLVTSLGASGTPGFFVNGRKITGAVPFESFKAVVDEELARAEAMVRAGTPPGQVYARLVERGATAPVFLPGAAPPPPGQAAAPQAPPRPPPAVYRKVDVRPDDPAKGARDAKLTIVLFSDFQCPFCSRVEPTLKRILEEKGRDVRIVWKHQPLSMHPNAVPAAMAAEAAREQGKFWDMHERLFTNQQDLTPAAFERYAREMRLDLARFKRGLESERARGRIQEDQRLAASVGASGTPTMFFNCRQVVGAQPYERMMPIVEEEIRKVDALLGSGARRDATLYQRACEANVAAAPAAAEAEAAPPPAPAPSLPPANVTLRPDDPVRGSARAPVTIALFSDFQCPFCSRVEPTLRQLEQDYRGKVKIAWKHQPLVQIHPHAIPAALAAEAAREQGKFWEMHDKLFANQAALPAAPYEQYAREIGLDVARWKQAYDSAKYRPRIEEDQRLAASLGIQGTPTLVVNGERVVGAVPYEQLKAVVDRKLAEARK
ncbi:MAG TPA: thioredoxin domain-containing protein [Anaeromyxobacteraceae bacterium]|nr:thioredoxin domain-containing protein [Anaeromyxobacteraceae bacterium]